MGLHSFHTKISGAITSYTFWSFSEDPFDNAHMKSSISWSDFAAGMKPTKAHQVLHPVALLFNVDKLFTLFLSIRRILICITIVRQQILHYFCIIVESLQQISIFQSDTWYDCVTDSVEQIIRKLQLMLWALALFVTALSSKTIQKHISYGLFSRYLNLSSWLLKYSGA